MSSELSITTENHERSMSDWVVLACREALEVDG